MSVVHMCRFQKVTYVLALVFTESKPYKYLCMTSSNNIYMLYTLMEEAGYYNHVCQIF
jgi:hypothetical protein